MSTAAARAVGADAAHGLEVVTPDIGFVDARMRCIDDVEEIANAGQHVDDAEPLAPAHPGCDADEDAAVASEHARKPRPVAQSLDGIRA